MALQALLAAGLIAVATWAAGRSGDRVGGLLSAFPAIVGPVLLLTAVHHGAPFAARAADGVLLGLVGLAAFVAVYGRAAPRYGWPAGLGLGWPAAALATLTAARWPGGALLLAVAALLSAWALLPRAPAAPTDRARGPLLTRSLVTAALVVGLTVAAGRLGPTAGGALAGLPVLATVLAVSTQRRRGGPAVLALLHGTLAGSASFVVFCEAITVLLPRVPIAVAFLAATAAALAAQVIAARCSGRQARPATAPGTRGRARGTARQRSAGLPR